MFSRTSLARKYLRYYFTAANGKGHGIHSPFVYDFVRRVLMDRGRYEAYDRVEGLRSRLRRDERVLEIEDMGAGSAVNGSTRRRVGDIARHAAKPRKLGQLLYRIAAYYQPGVVVELGTSLGLSAVYLAKGMENGHLYTIEGAASVAAVAVENFSSLGLTNVTSLVGNFDVQLGPLLDEVGRFDLAFVDGNHRYGPTMQYFDVLVRHASSSSILIFDDIHWSEEMERAWDEIRRDPRVFMTIDLFFIGLVVLREEFKIPQHFAIRF